MTTEHRLIKQAIAELSSRLEECERVLCAVVESPWIYESVAYDSRTEECVEQLIKRCDSEE